MICYCYLVTCCPVKSPPRWLLVGVFYVSLFPIVLVEREADEKPCFLFTTSIIMILCASPSALTARLILLLLLFYLNNCQDNCTGAIAEATIFNTNGGVLSFHCFHFIFLQSTFCLLLTEPPLKGTTQKPCVLRGHASHCGKLTAAWPGQREEKRKKEFEEGGTRLYLRPQLS